jgi:outer membrane protein OmpA-like peptidoglycan-associated protein
MPESVPDTATIAPIAPQPPPPGTQPPPPPPVSDKATTAAAPTTSGLRLTFASGASDLSPESSASIKQLTQDAPKGDETTFNVLAYAPGKPDDPSTARRVSLSRAMAVRSALVADGVPSARIFVRALGEQYGDGPPDRVDLSVTGANTPATPPSSTAATAR